MSSLAPFGLTPQGFLPKTQAQVLAELGTVLQQTYGQNVNLSAESNLGQLIGVFAEREALLWQLIEAVYASQYPGGAEGTAVDNILALSNLSRLPASATVTNPAPTTLSNGETLYGLVLGGVAGTVVPAGSLIRTSTTPQLSFTLDAPVTIQAAVNAQQNLVLSQAPTSGTFQLSLVDPSGATLSTPLLPYNTLPNTTQLSFSGTPTGGQWYLMAGAMLVGPLAYNVTAAQLQAAIVALGTGYTGITVAGSMAAGFAIAFPANTYNRNFRTNATLVTFSSAPTGGTFTLTVGGANTAALAYNATAAQVQAALLALGYPRAQVAAIAGASPGYAINWSGFGTAPTAALASSTTNVAPSVQPANQLTPTVTPTVLPSLQCALNGLYNTTSSTRPYTDLAVTGGGTVFALGFGAFAAQAGQGSSAAQPEPQLQVVQNSLFSGGSYVNVATAIGAVGAAAQGIGTATCTVTGPNAAPAGTLSVIGSPLTGWATVTNPLDALTGQNAESDTAALARRTFLQGSQANGPLQAIVQKVEQVAGVTQAAGFQNTSDAAVQTLAFAAAPTSGTFQLLTQAGTTAALGPAPTAQQVQAALAALTGYANVLVSGNVTYGFLVDFNGAMGAQPQALLQPVNNTTGVTITPGYGRAAKSFEIVVQGGQSAAVAQAIYAAQPAGIVAYGTPAAVTQGAVTAGSPSATVASAQGIVAGQAVFGQGVANNTTVLAVAGTTVTLSAAALASAAGALTFSNATQILDAFGNPTVIAFSRPVPVPFYVALQLVTDIYRTPGVASSGLNPQSVFSPASVPLIQSQLCAIGNAVPIGGTVVGQGSGALVGAFNNVPGILGYTLAFGTQPSPTQAQNIALLPTQDATFQTFNVAVSYT